jgi:hypothetical protein
MPAFDRIVVALARAETDGPILAYAALLARLGNAGKSAASTSRIRRRQCR